MAGESPLRIVKSPAVVLVAILVVATGWLAFRDWREGAQNEPITRREQMETATPATTTPAPATPATATPATEKPAPAAPALGNPASESAPNATSPAPAAGGSPVIEAMRREGEVILGGAKPQERFSGAENDGESWLSAENLLINALVIVLLTIGLVLVLKLFKRWVPGSQHFFGSSAIRIHGRNAIGARQAIYLIQVGDHLLVVGATQDRLQTLAQIDDPDEIARVLASTQAASAESSTRNFKDLLSGNRKNLKPNERAVEDLAPVFSDGALTERGRDDS